MKTNIEKAIDYIEHISINLDHSILWSDYCLTYPTSERLSPGEFFDLYDDRIQFNSRRQII